MKDMTFKQLETAVLAWADERGLLDDFNPNAQAAKMIEEASEILMGMAHNNYDEIVDGIGDTVVTLILLAHMYGATTTACLQAAYDEIKDRKGKTVNGQFIKEEA